MGARVKKDTNIILRISSEEKAELEKKAKAEDRTVANYILHNMNKSKGKCRWKEHKDNDELGIYDTDCGETFFFSEGTAKENKFNYCPYCGKRIEAEDFKGADRT